MLVQIGNFSRALTQLSSEMLVRKPKDGQKGELRVRAGAEMARKRYSCDGDSWRQTDGCASHQVSG